MTTNKIIEGLREAIAGDIARVTIDGVTWVRADIQDDEIDRLRKEVVRLAGNFVRMFSVKNAAALRASRAEAKVEEMAWALRQIGSQSVMRGRGQIGAIRALVNAALSEIEPGRPAADAPKGDGRAMVEAFSPVKGSEESA